MKTIKYFVYSMLASSVTLIAACSTTTDPSEAYKGETAQQIFQNGETALHNRSYGEAIKRFEALDVQYPFGRDTETAQLHIIYAYYKNSDYLSAETAADRFIHAHPTSPYVDYAYYMRGLSNYYQNLGVFERLFSVDYATRDLTQIKKSYNDFAQLEKQFPQSRYASAAHQYMIYLRNVLANHQIEVAQYYFDHEAYVAAANRASIVVQNYQGSPVVPDALVLMAKSYYQLHQPQMAEQVISVIRYNYPNTRYDNAVSQAQIANTHFSVSVRKEKIVTLSKQTVVVPPTQTQTQTTMGTTLGSLWNQLSDSKLFSLHSNSVPTTSAAVSNVTEGEQSVQPMQPMQEANAQSQTSPVNTVKKTDNLARFQSNGIR